ncbi:hypothetical protein CRE_19084 [Caenorhabditis remanei]|uniref:Uncharacterized protein n=1 Tax=Caenorhabditis remanei TaxID=31234 RepID=E3LJQ0_CAERE|nr:hypothetical protein CRE_19084 [Caenorhabditis remanei]
MSRQYRNRKGHDLEKVVHRFTDDDLSELKPKKVFAKKWIIIKKLDKRGAAHCYQVCDTSFKIFGVLYLETGNDNVTSIANQVEFSLQQFSLGYSHRFTNVIDSNIINNHLFYMVQRTRPGPTLETLLKCIRSDDDRLKVSSITASFIAIDIISILELLNSSGHVLRNFDTKQWKLDVKTRMFYLDDITDVQVSSDKRHRSIDEIHIINAETLNLAWTSNDILYAPIEFIVNGEMHRMSELDQLEMLIYILFDWTRGKLPWKNSKCQQRTLEMKRDFLENFPDPLEKFEEPVDHWFSTALHNLADHLKVAKIAQAKLEKQAVRGGAWCPKGPRAGALLSIINYRRIVEDFQKIVCSGRPEWSVYWRDIKLDWDKEVELTPEQSSFLQKYEKRQKCLEVVDERARLDAIRVHYSVMEEHGKFEREKNQISIEQYLRGGDPNDPDEKEEIERQIAELRKKRMQKIQDEIKEEDEEMDMKIDIKDEIDDYYDYYQGT